MTRRGWLLFAAMGVIWGLPYLLIKVAVSGLSPATLVFARTALGALLLVPLVVRRDFLARLRGHWPVIVVYTAIEIGLPWFLLSDAERRISSSLAGLLVAAVPLIGSVIAAATGSDDRLDGRRLLGLGAGVTGVAALLGLDLGARDVGALLEMAVVTVCYAVGPVIIARRLADLPAGLVVAASLVLTAIAYAPVAAVQHPTALPPARVLAAVGALAVVCTALAFLLFFALIAEVGPVRATIITYVNPAVAVALGVVVLHEPFTAGTGIGFVLILTGSVLATRPARPPGRRRAVPLLSSSRLRGGEEEGGVALHLGVVAEGLAGEGVGDLPEEAAFATGAGGGGEGGASIPCAPLSGRGQPERGEDEGGTEIGEVIPLASVPMDETAGGR